MSVTSQNAKHPEQGLEDALIEDVAQFYDDPLGFVIWSLPWGEPGTSLADEDGPDEWQEELLEDLGDAIRAGIDVKDAVAVMIAAASGHGVGKSALVAWIVLWFISTRENPQIVVTAGTQEQLRSKTWRELAKWHKLCLTGPWFTWTATRLYHKRAPEDWFAAAIPWSVNRSEAFAGTHEKHVLVIFDEASQIENVIWETTEGAMTTPGAIWIVFGNPTRNSGRFAECWGRFKHRWTHYQVDSRRAKKANRAQIEQWIADYGEDSDFVRVRVRGVFPRAGSLQYIGSDIVRAAMLRKVDPSYTAYARVMALDVARHGDDQSVFCKRQGKYTSPLERYRIADTMLLADVAAEKIDTFEPDAFFVDATGIGWGVVDRLVQMNYKVVIAVQTGEAAIENAKYYNRAAELWGRGKTWLEEGGCLPDDNELEQDLIARQYGYDGNHRVQLEKKEDMKKRGLASPDSGDSLMLTFATPVQPKKDHRNEGWRSRLRSMRKRHKHPMAS